MPTSNNSKNQELTFWDHLDVLRAMLLRVGGVWLLAAIVLFAAMPQLFDRIVLGPCHGDFPLYRLIGQAAQALGLAGGGLGQALQIKLVNIDLAAPFLIHLSTACAMSVVVVAPYVVWELWRFIRPALYPNERRGVGKAFGLGTLMFYAGVAVSYFVVWPLTLRFLYAYPLSMAVENQISLRSYIDNFMMLTLCMGVAFELPVLTWLLSLLGIVDRSMLQRYRRHAAVAVVVLAAIITPTGDPFTLAVVAVPLYLLYELGIRLTRNRKAADQGHRETPRRNEEGNGRGGEPS